MAKHRLQQAFGTEIDESRITFVRHHSAHAASAFALSGFERSLVLAIDGNGDFLSGLVAVGEDMALKEIERFSQSQSLGEFYVRMICFLGNGPFDEYKVMGLGSYGNSVVYRPLLKELGEGIVNLGRTIVLGAGKVVAAGTHESLYQQCPLYQALWEPTEK